MFDSSVRILGIEGRGLGEGSISTLIEAALECPIQGGGSWTVWLHLLVAGPYIRDLIRSNGVSGIIDPIQATNEAGTITAWGNLTWGVQETNPAVETHA